MPFLCECRGPCKRSLNLTPDTYRDLSRLGAVLAPECAVREDRRVLREVTGAVAATTYGWRRRSHQLSYRLATNP